MSRFIPRLAVALLTFIVSGAVYFGLAVFSVEAGPASPVVKTFRQPDGTIIQLQLWGDEFAHGCETLDGFTVVKNLSSGYWEYAVRNALGELVPSGVVVARGLPPAPAHLRPSESVINAARADFGAMPQRGDGHRYYLPLVMKAARADFGAMPLGVPTPSAAPPWASGNTNVLVIMVQFPADPGDPDGSQPAVSCTFTAAQMQANLFGATATGPGNLTDYYNEISYNALNLVGTVVGCFTVANDKNDYDDGPSSAAALVAEAIALADASVDFAPYDNDGDSVVDQVAIAYAGGGPDNGCYTGADPNTNNLWPHASSIGAVTVDSGARTVSSYYIAPELLCGTTIRTIGVYAHEFGHKLGLPDLYDTDSSSTGIGWWGLMGSGSWTSNTPLFENGEAPSHMTPWSKWFLGWITPVDYTGLDVNGAILQAETNPYAIRLLNNPGGPDDWPGSGEYFLVENRQQVGFDIGLPGCGVLVWHIDESLGHNRNEGHTADSHRLVDPEEADGIDPMPNRGDGGDPFPGTSGNRFFNDTTTPHSRLYDGTNTNIKVEVVSTGCEATMLVNFGTIPIANCGGPYVTDEGIDQGLDGNGSIDPDGDPLTCDWDLNNDGNFNDAIDDCTPTFDQVGQDGVFPIALKVTDPGGVFDIDECTVTINNVAPSVSLASDAPKDEGATVTVNGTVSDPGWLDPLSATIDWDDGTVEPIAGVLENIRPDATLTFDVSHTYGDNDDYDVEVCASDDDTTTCETIVLHIDNVPPDVDIDPAQVMEIDEGDFLDVLANFSDPGWLDTYTSLIDWGTGESDAGTLVVTVEGPPFDQGQVTGSHQYGDNGLFPVTVTVTDDDLGAGSDSFDLTVSNVDPTAEIDESGAILINGVPTFLAHAGDPLDFSGRSTDPGSDDLFLSWDWDDGPPSPDVTTTYLVNPPNPDPFPSPSVQPRDVTDMQTHAFADACLYVIGFLADDDDGGHSDDNANVIIAGNADRARSEGYWQHQYSGKGHIDFDQTTLECYLAIIDYVSTVFNEERDASTIERAHDVLFLKENKGSATEQLDRELLTVWLNFANGAIEYNELLDTDKDGIGDTAFSDVVATAEAVRLDPNATEAEIKEQTNILHHIKQMSD